MVFHIDMLHPIMQCIILCTCDAALVVFMDDSRWKWYAQSFEIYW